MAGRIPADFSTVTSQWGQGVGEHGPQALAGGGGGRQLESLPHLLCGPPTHLVGCGLVLQPVCHAGNFPTDMSWIRRLICRGPTLCSDHPGGAQMEVLAPGLQGPSVLHSFSKDVCGHGGSLLCDCCVSQGRLSTHGFSEGSRHTTRLNQG